MLYWLVGYEVSIDAVVYMFYFGVNICVRILIILFAVYNASRVFFRLLSFTYTYMNLSITNFQLKPCLFKRDCSIVVYWIRRIGEFFTNEKKYQHLLIHKKYINHEI